MYDGRKCGYLELHEARNNEWGIWWLLRRFKHEAGPPLNDDNTLYYKLILMGKTWT